MLFLLVSVLTLIESPAPFLELMKKPLSEYGVKYGEMKGGFLSGFTLKDVNYNEQVQLKELTLKVDFDALKKRVLLIDNLVVDNLEVNKDFLAGLIDANSSETNTTQPQLPFDRVVVNNASLSLKNITYQNYHLKDLQLEVHDVETDMKERHKGTLKLWLKSNVINGKLKAKIKNNNYHLIGSLEAEKEFSNEFLAEQNVTLLSNPSLKLKIDGNLEELKYDIDVQRLNLKQNDYQVKTNKLHTFGSYGIKSSDVVSTIKSKLVSNLGNLKLDSYAKLNLEDINNTLAFNLQSNLDLNTQYLNTILKDSNVTLSGKTPITFKVNGDFKRLKIDLLTSTHLLAQGILSEVTFQSKNLQVNLQKHLVQGASALDSNAKNIALHLKSNIEGDYMNPQKLKSDSSVILTKFNAFGVNLNSLTPLNLKLQNEGEQVNLSLDSKKIKLHANSANLKDISFSLHTQNIYPDKIVKVPPELKKKFVKLNLEGSANIEQKYFKVDGDVGSNKKFKLNLHVQNSANGLSAKLFSKHLVLKARGDIKEKNIETTIKVDSLKKLQKEFNRLYTFEPVPIEGSLTAKAKLKGEQVFLDITTPKLKLKGFNVEKIAINALYADDLITVNRLSFNTTGFKKSSLNQRYYLNQKGLIHLGDKRDVLLDMHPKILLKAKGDKDNLKANLQVEALPLGHPDYGDMLLSCDLDYLQNLEKKKISGGVFLGKLKLFYESKYLDPSFDNDVIVLSKKDKRKKKSEDDFLKNTAIDVAIFGSEANYKTKDIDLKFTVNVHAKKRFGKTLRMLGKIEEINGRVEQAPKLFSVVDSNIVFRGAKEINPLLDLTVKHELPDILITIAIHGNAKRPKLTFSSNPPLPKKDILSYLLLGVSTANLTEGKGSLGREAQLFIMNQAARDLAYDVDLDRVFIKDDGTGEGYAVQVGKKVNDDTIFVIETSKEGNSFILEYDVNKNIKVEVGQHQKVIPSQSIDLYFRKRFK